MADRNNFLLNLNWWQNPYLELSADVANMEIQLPSLTPKLKPQTKPNFGLKLSTLSKNVFNSAVNNPDMLNGIMKGTKVLEGLMGLKRGTNATTEGIDNTVDALGNSVGDIAMKINPAVGTAIKLGTVATGLVGKALNKISGGTDGVTKADKILDSNLGMLTGIGFINAVGGKKANVYYSNDQLNSNTDGGFLGFLNLDLKTGVNAGKKYGLFSSGARHELNELTKFTLGIRHTVSGIVSENDLNLMSIQGSTPFIVNNINSQLAGGYGPIMAARSGGQFAKRVVSLYRILKEGEKINKSTEELVSSTKAINPELFEELKLVDSYKNGGQMNVIPEGALHARKHHLTDIDDKFKEVTNKGIPVITEENGGEVIQHAEIEHSEIIFNKEVTDKLEELRKQYNESKDDLLAIEAGKLLTLEILYNTDDRVGLIDSIN